MLLSPSSSCSILRPADPDGGLWSRWPSVGDLRPASNVHNLYTLRICLSRRIEDLEETVRAITGHLCLFHLMVDHDARGRTRFTFTLETSDLWQATLLTMNAVTCVGHTPIALTAEPASDYEDAAN